MVISLCSERNSSNGFMTHSPFPTDQSSKETRFTAFHAEISFLRITADCSLLSLPRQCCEQADRDGRRHKMQHNHRPEDVDGHSWNSKHAQEGHDGHRKREDQGKDRKAAVEPKRTASKATDEHERQHGEQQIDRCTHDDHRSLQVLKTIRDAKEGDCDPTDDEIDQNYYDDGERSDPHEFA